MSSILPGYEYDIFISYRQNDNKRDGWVTEFINTLNDELEATVKDKLSIYFDENPYEGLGETHNVDDSLANKLKCLIFIPIISKTYCDPNSFAWTSEFLAFNKLANNDEYGLKVTLPNGNSASRVLPIRIHDIDDADKHLVEAEIGFLRAIDFVYQEAGVNRPLKPEDGKEDNLNKTSYRNQINKVANAIQEIISSISAGGSSDVPPSEETVEQQPKKIKESNKLKSRNVIKAGLVYILFALVFWKVADISISHLRTSVTTLKFISLGLILIFPIAVLFAWLYERSPHGFIRTGSVASRRNPFTDAQKKPLTSNTFSTLLIITVVALFLIFPQSNFNRIFNPNTTTNSTNKSIAVLYFDNMSGDPDQEYFSDGITEEITSHLSTIKGLRVTSRTSVLPYKGTAINLRQIANELNVGNILEGSVRKDGDKLRITAQLIDAQTDQHIWTEVYDRDLADVFKIQSEIAHAIADKFKITITPEADAKIDKPPTTNIKAYELYLKARAIPFVAGRGIGTYYGEAEKSISMLKEAITLDPDFVQAYVFLSKIYLNYSNDVGPFMDYRYDSAMLLAKEAIIRDPKSADGYIALANTQNFDESLRWLRKAYELDSLQGLLGLANAFTNNGEFPKAIQCYSEAVKFDPNSYDSYLGMANIYYYMAEVDSMKKYLSLANKIVPNSKQGLAILINWASFSGQNEDTKEAYKMYYEVDTLNYNKQMGIAYIMAKDWQNAESYYLRTDYRDMDWGLVLINTGRRDSGVAVLRKSLAYRGPQGWSGDLSRINAVLGNKERAIAEFKKLIDLGWHDIGWVRIDPFWDEIREEPEFKKMVENMERRNIEMLDQINENRNKKFSFDF
jgi:TolB-like protein